MTKLLDVLTDTVKHTHGVGLFSKVKVSGDSESTKLVSHSDDKNVFLYGSFKEPVTELTDEEVGMTRLEVLSGFVQLPDYREDTATIEVGTKELKDGSKVPFEVKFKTATGGKSSYRLTTVSTLPESSRKEWDVSEFNGAEFDINFQPSLSALNRLNKHSSILGSYESTFTPETRDGNLYFNIGSGSSDLTSVLIQEDVGFELKQKMVWKLENILPILKLSDNETTIISLNDDFLMQILVDSSVCTYTYLLPAQAT